MAQQPCACVLEGDTTCAFEHLNHDALALHLHNTPLAHRAIVHADVDYLFKGSIFYIVQNDQGAIDLLDTDIIQNHIITCFPMR